jgi:DNA repair protein RadC
VFVKEKAGTCPATTFEDGPRERILHLGAESLSDRDLVAAMIGNGIRGCNVFKLADLVLESLEENRFHSDPRQLLLIPGMGPAKVSQLSAAFELARRVLAPRNYRIRHPSDVLPLLHHYADRPQEHFIVITLNGAHEVITVHVASVGLVNRTLVHPREVFSEAIRDRAVAVVCAHNHPSGKVHPSDEDQIVTRSLQEAGEILGIRLLDHIVFSGKDHFSFLEHDKL